MGAVVGQHVVVGTVGGLLDVEGAQVAVAVAAVVVVEAIGGVAGLLNLGHHAAGTDGVDAAGGNEEDVALADFILCQGLHDGLVGNHLPEPLGICLYCQSVVESGAGCRRQYVPHLGLSALQSVAAGCLVVGVYLYGEVVAGVDKLEEQRELVAVALVDAAAHELFLQHGDEPVERHAAVGTFGHDGLIALDTRYFPAFADVVAVADALEARYLAAAPELGLYDRFKLEHFVIIGFVL